MVFSPPAFAQEQSTKRLVELAEEFRTGRKDKNNPENYEVLIRMYEAGFRYNINVPKLFESNEPLDWREIWSKSITNPKGAP